MKKDKAEFKLEVVQSFLAGEGGARLSARRWSVPRGASHEFFQKILTTRKEASDCVQTTLGQNCPQHVRRMGRRERRQDE